MADKDRSITNYREDNVKLKKENSELKREVLALKATASRTREREQESNANNENTEGARENREREREQIRAMRDNFRQIQMAMAMNEIEHRVQERSMLMHALHGGGGAMISAQAEEERLL